MLDVPELKDALDLAVSRGASYADVRVVRRRQESISVKNGAVSGVSMGEDEGFGVRVLVDGAWGFASSSRLDLDEALRVADEAVRIARASATVKRRDVALAPTKPVTGSHVTPCNTDPFEVPIDEKIQLLLDADRLAREDKRVRVSTASMSFFEEEKTFVSSEGAVISQKRVESGAGLSAFAAGPNDVQRRSYPAAFGGDFACAGYEFVEALDLPGHAEKVGREAGDLLDAPQCPSMTTTVILGTNQMALQIHESCGHPSELDRVFGTEASYAGTSFLTPDKKGSFRYGSELVNITADATIPGGLGSFGYDDEGVPAQRTPLVDGGIFVNYLTSRETAARLGERSNGAMRADGPHRMPIIRMTNINLEPGDWTLDEMIRDTKEGILLDTNKSWSIDDRRLNFQFGTEVGYLIRDGAIGQMVKNPTYTGITPEFWGSCDAVGTRGEWHLWGVPNCGKGEPPQLAHVGHGSAPARFRNVRVGVGRW
ncbi:MAG TPA: TldD/PmbA family protein [Firmicutes bacterium]|mgnify:CR=1 FL=1|nr:TldD/PmbA family protein [Bacillota bacterium]